MTIREFAQLCGCNPQTLRYYDHADLLKPVKTDPWTGYRYYDESQAEEFVKIKNLQKAGFTIEQIRNLAGRGQNEIFDAISRKIEDLENRLREVKEIQKSYQNEMTQIRKKIEDIQKLALRSMEEFDPAEEFGIDEEQYEEIVGMVRKCFSEAQESIPDDLSFEDIGTAENTEKTERCRELLNSPDYEAVYEKHGWQNGREFIRDISELKDGGEYAVCIAADNKKSRHIIAFMNTLLGILLKENEGKSISITCDSADSPDGKNHFTLLKHR